MMRKCVLFMHWIPCSGVYAGNDHMTQESIKRLHLGWNGHSLECRLFGVANGFFCEKLAPLTEQCNDAAGDLLEDVLFRAVKGMSSDTIVMRFSREPHFGGVPGHFIQNLAFSQSHDCAKEKVKRFIGNFIRIFLPWLKF